MRTVELRKISDTRDIIKNLDNIDTYDVKISYNPVIREDNLLEELRYKANTTFKMEISPKLKNRRVYSSHRRV